MQRRASNNASSWGTVSNLLSIDITTSNIIKTRDYGRIESCYLAQPISQQDKTEERYTVIPTTPMNDYSFDKTNSKGPGTVPGDWASLQ